MGKTVVIVGGVAGGASCAARLRRLDENAEIILMERGKYISYANCGLPYYIGGTIRSRTSLLVQTPEAMKKKYRIDVRTENEVTSIDTGAKTVTVKKADGETYLQPYDELVLSTGSSPVRPPIPGIESPRVRTLWTVPDADAIREEVTERNAKRAVVIGGGFIGLEAAENLVQAGVETSLVEMLDQVMVPLDFEMAQMLHEGIRRNGVKLYLSDGAAAFEDHADGMEVVLKSGKRIRADLVILAVGVRPNSALAKEAGLTLGARGGIVTDAHQRTSDPSVYAVGDVTEVTDLVSGEPAMVPLAGPANRQGRIAADSIAGMDSSYRGSQGTAVAKVFDLSAASTGSNEKTLQKRGLVRGKDYESIIITQNSHASYYPGAVPLTLKLLFSMDGKKIFGAQIVGADGVDKRIDTIAAVLRMGGGIDDLAQMEFSYAPPYSSAKDPVNMAGFTAQNLLRGIVRFAAPDAVEKQPDTVLLDVREDAERMAFSLPNAVHIPLGQLRDRIGELDRTKAVITFCTIGVRSYNAARILMQNGFADVSVYPGGTRFYQAVHSSEETAEQIAGPAGPCGNAGSAAAAVSDSGMEQHTADAGHTAGDAAPKVSIHVDCSGLQCPGPLMKVFETIQTMQDGEVMEVSASDPGFTRDIQSWCRRTGNTLLSAEQRGKEYTAVVRKGSGSAAPDGCASQSGCLQTGGMPSGSMLQAGASGTPVVHDTPEGKTIIVFSGDLDKVLASFIIANGAAAMGRKVTMFFTFWGLTVLRRSEKQPVRKTFVESMFGGMLPRGSRKLKLSRMNMGGIGTAMMKQIMQDKNVDSLETLIEKAIHAGVKIIACTMSMDVMGIKQEELIDGVELGGVGTYLGDAEESNVNLFI